MSKKALLDDLRAARAEFLAAIEGLSEDEMLRPGVEGIWSVKDIIAHLIAWEAELVTALNRKLSPAYRNAPPIVLIEDIDEWNMEQYHQHANRPLDILLPDFHGVHKHLLLAIEGLDEQLLEDPLRFEWMEGEPLAYLIQETATWHEQEHAESIRAWRRQLQQEATP
ncbi:MAG: ClbS/DfsB family four-helix bundle protein [Anaerolineae bacterium]|nr:ClbS/DfsB family four-helix bundle protein [Anaerolineae bacterium]